MKSSSLSSLRLTAIGTNEAPPQTEEQRVASPVAAAERRRGARSAVAATGRSGGVPVAGRVRGAPCRRVGQVRREPGTLAGASSARVSGTGAVPTRQHIPGVGGCVRAARATVGAAVRRAPLPSACVPASARVAQGQDAGAAHDRAALQGQAGVRCSGTAPERATPAAALAPGAYGAGCR
jgi:hypothetical protein